MLPNLRCLRLEKSVACCWRSACEEGRKAVVLVKGQLVDDSGKRQGVALGEGARNVSHFAFHNLNARDHAKCDTHRLQSFSSEAQK